MYLGYCEGVIGHFNAESVHFVELDPRVLESLDAEYLDPERQSILSFDSQQQRSLYNMPRHSLISLSCSITSDQYSIQQRQQQWARRSFESLTTANSSSISTQHYQQQSGSYLSYDATNQSKYLTLRLNQEINPLINLIDQQEQVYDTSAFNIDYSDDDDDDDEQFYNTQPQQTPLSLSATSPLQKRVPFESDHTTTDDEADELYQQKHFSKTINTTTLANNSNVIYLPNKFTNNNNNNINNDKHVDEFGFLLTSKKSLSR
jgi:hypothetical protein